MRLKRYFSVIRHTANNIELRHGAFNAVSHYLDDEGGDGTLGAIVAALDGRDLNDVARQANVPRSAVESVIDHLIQIGAVEDGPASAIDAYYDTVIPSLRDHQSRLQPERAVVILGARGAGERIAASLANLAPDLSIEVVDDGDARMAGLSQLKLDDFDTALARADTATRFAWLGGRLVVLVQEQVNPHRALLLNRLALQHDCPFLWGAVDGPALFVGPFTLPRQSSCYQCFETRVMMNLREYKSYQLYKHALAEGQVLHKAPPLAPALTDILCGHLAMEAMNYLLTGTAFTVGKTLCLYLPSMEFSFNEVLKVPDCPACGSQQYLDEPELYYDIRAVLNATGTP